jgi:photosystem II stability/assembly factor-like uncharacterized protein
MKNKTVALSLLLSLLASLLAAAETPPKENKKGKKDPAAVFAGLEFRSIGPALTSGRILDLAVHPKTPHVYYVATAGGGVWKTTNAGTTFEPIFDGQASHSIGCITLDPNDPRVVWVGSGENNSHRSVSWGDGVYKSNDGGKSWENVGLKKSEHIGRIVVDPRNSQVVYVAAQGPLWSAGGERGLYKTTDGGKTWKAVLSISENTGVNEVVIDPRNPDVLYASAYQRRRHVWTILNGGPESAIYKSTDAGASWKKLTAGLPKEDLGRIGLAISPVDPDIVYAFFDAARDAGGVYRSTDAGANWEKRSDYVSSSPQYYQEIFADPKDADRLYSADMKLMVSEDGGKSFAEAGEHDKHVDNHALWIDPANTDHLLVGCDGGLYESYDRAATWEFKPNLPITQFYRITTDNSLPFYNVYGGTQDNFSLGGPSRTRNTNGIVNANWFVTQGGDGFVSRVDPEDPDTVYAEAQYGELGRYDRKTGLNVDIQPQPGPGEEALRFNWDAPLIISPHSHTRLYFAANRLFRSDDRGDSWRPVSPDLTRQIDRNTLPVMGRLWSIDAVFRHGGTSFYGNVVSLAESPVKEGLLWVGTDDGLIQVSPDGGATWRKIEKFPGVPENTYVSRLEASRFDGDTVYAAFDNHKRGDFKPYLLKSTDLGKTWTSIASDLPERNTVYALVEDPVDRNLLFAGTEYGLFFTQDGGKKWWQLKGGLPISAVRDLTLQEREHDLVLATFGRGFYILDDYTPLRLARPELLEKEAVLFPVKDAPMFVEASPFGERGKGFQGTTYFTAPNPPFGAVFTYHVKDTYNSRKKQRWEREKKTLEEKEGVVEYPSREATQAELREDDPYVLLTVSDETGQVIRRLQGPATAGFHRVAWDLRFPPADPVSLEEPEADRAPRGPMVAPGEVKVELAKVIDEERTPLGEARSFAAQPVGAGGLVAADRTALVALQEKTARLQRAVQGAEKALEEARERLRYAAQAARTAPRIGADLAKRVKALDGSLRDLSDKLSGDSVRNARNEPTPPSIADRVQRIVEAHWEATAAPTRTLQDNYAIAAADFAPVLAQLRQLIERDLAQLDADLEAAGAPWTPGRLPAWKPE